MAQVVAPMAGTVVEVLVKVGDSVKADTDVVLLESMKMEVPVTADVAGSVSEIQIHAGDFVNEGDVLVMLDKA